jgi:two-component system LytT family sensor kinase
VRKALAAFIIVAGLLAASPLHAQDDTIVLGDSEPILNSNISSYCRVQIDSAQDLSILRVTRQLFADQRLFHEGAWENRKPHTYWIRFTIRNQGSADYDLYFFTGYHDFMYFFGPSSDTTYRLLQTAGLMLGRGGRSRWDQYAFPLPVPATSTRTFYLRITDKYYVENPLEPMLLNQSGLNDYKLQQIWLSQPSVLLIILLMGMLVVMFCYMAVSYRQSPEKSYLYYGLLILGLMFFYSLRLESYPYQISFFGYFPMLKYFWDTSALLFCLYLIYVLFARAFLNLKEMFPMLDKALAVSAWIFGGLVIADLILLFEGQYYASNILYVTVYFATIIPFIVLFFILSRRNDNPLIQFFLAGSICLFLAQLVTHSFTVLNELGVTHLPPTLSPEYSLLVGIVTELLFFAIGLNYKNKLVHIRNAHAQERLIGELNKNKTLQIRLNEELELQVREQTFEILKKNKELEQQRQVQLETDYNRRLTEIELRAIRSQINPHFIFNCMNSIQLFVMQRDFDSAQKYLTDFSLLIRKTLDMSKLNFVSLTDEVNYLNTYLSLEKMRFESRMDYEVYVDPDLIPSEAEVPSMLLQPYVENAVKHGINNQINGKGKLVLSFYQKDEDLICTIEDNGIGIRRSMEQKQDPAGRMHISTGMELSSNRAELLNKMFNTAIRIEVIDKEEMTPAESGTLVKITIPQL